MRHQHTWSEARRPAGGSSGAHGAAHARLAVPTAMSDEHTGLDTGGWAADLHLGSSPETQRAVTSRRGAEWDKLTYWGRAGR